MVTFLSQDTNNDACDDFEIGLCAQNIEIVLSFVIHTTKRACGITQREKEPTLDLM